MPIFRKKTVFTHHLVSSLSLNVCTVPWLGVDCSPLSTSVLCRHVEDSSVTNILLVNKENYALKLVAEIILLEC